MIPKKTQMMPFLISLMLITCCSSCNNKDDVGGGKSDKPYLRVNVCDKMVTNDAGSFEVFVSSNTDWTVQPRSSWISVDRDGAKGDMSIVIRYEKNNTPKRTGVLRLTAENVNPVEVIITQSALSFTNPVTTGTMPDPYIVKDGGKYYACKAGGGGIAISSSTRLTVINETRTIWTPPYDSGNTKVWNRSNIWAPELFHIGDRWYIYYAAGRPTSENNGSYCMQRSGVLRSKTIDPMGEWEDMGMLYTGTDFDLSNTPDADNTEYAIDLTTFEMKGQRYAVWSGNGKHDGIQQIRIAKMSNPYTISSSYVVLSTPEQSWETIAGTVNEGPAILINEVKNKLFIIYSCNGSWTKYYRLGWLMLNMDKYPMVAKNWTKSSGAVFDRCDNTSSPTPGVNGVGHCSFTKSLDDTEDYIIYHVMKFRHDNDGGGGWSTRYPFIQKFTWNEDGTPNFGTPAGWGEPQLLPSGETI